MKTERKNLKDFGMYVCLNREENEVALCAWCGKTKRFINLDHEAEQEFNATHFTEYPDDDSQGKLI